MKKIFIAGAGAMGSQIASVFRNSYPNSTVFLYDVSGEQLDKARESHLKWEKKDKAKNPALTPAPIQFVSDTNGLDGACDLLIEAVSENINIKEKIFQLFNNLSDFNSVIASNTSSLSLTRMATFVDPAKRPNVVGLHFFNPARIMQLVEIIVAQDTSEQTLQRSEALVKEIAKTPVTCKDAPGFITSRLGIVMINEALFVLQEGLSTAEEIDTAIKLGYNHPMGPLALADFIGLDIVFSVTQTLYENFQDPKYRPPVILRKLVEAGHLGKKTGRGIYNYS